MKKKCKKCGVIKRLNDYYVHSEMADNHLNICKDCVRKRIREYNRSPHGREMDRKRNQRPARKKWLIEYQRKRRAENKLKYWCYNKFYRAVLDGKIKRAKRCSKPGCNSKKNIEGHHEDYSKPFEVTWLCQKCHRKLCKQFQRKVDTSQLKT